MGNIESGRFELSQFSIARGRSNQNGHKEKGDERRPIKKGEKKPGIGRNKHQTLPRRIGR